MKAAALFLSSVVVGFAAAQGTNTLPDCAKSCADGFLKNGIGNCGTEVKCICENKNFLGDIACCLEGKCDKTDQNSAVAYASQLCVAFQVTDLPTAVSCTATAATVTSPNYGPRETAKAGLGAIGGIIAAAALL